MAAPIGLSTVTSNMEEVEFLSSFIHASLFLLNRKKRQCDKYYNGFPNSKMLDVKNIYFVYINFRYTIPSDCRCSVRVHKIAGPNPGPISRRLEMSLGQPSSERLPVFCG